MDSIALACGLVNGDIPSNIQPRRNWHELFEQWRILCEYNGFAMSYAELVRAWDDNQRLRVKQ